MNRRRFLPKRWCLVPVLALGITLSAQAPVSNVVESVVDHGRQIKGLVALDVDGKSVSKRFVLRMPAARWNGLLVIGAHGGGGGITRLAAEDEKMPYAGTLIIAGAGGDLATRLDQQTRMAALWPLIDPRANYGIPATDPKIRAYAEAVGTPVEARRLWPYTGPRVVPGTPVTIQYAPELVTGGVRVPTIEVVGTWDDLVVREVRAYRDRVQPRDRHRLYQVEGVWHMSSDDDGVMSFQYIATSRMTLDPDVANAMGEGPSYLATVREAFDHLVRWVEQGVPAPANQTVKPGARLAIIGK
ncbi:MAG: alpha/beta hydrolase domain-containing protein [Acidobacteriota bacterium]|nr:alpha/beta hydrolase domain-containing protein [Acidobacteriota bacterium]